MATDHTWAGRRFRAYGRYAGEVLLATLALYFVLYLTVLAHINQRFSPIYPAAGLALALLWIYGARYWPAIFISSTAISWVLGSTWLTATGNGWIDTLVALIAVCMLQRLKVQPSLLRMRDLAGFGLSLIVSNAVTIPFYAAYVGFASGFPADTALYFGLHYFCASAFGFLVFTPIFTVGSLNGHADRRQSWLLAGSLAVIAFIGLSVFMAGEELRERLLFLTLPFVMTCAVAGRMRGASLAATLLGLIMIGLESRTGSTVLDVSLRGLFVATLSVTGYLLAVVFNERERSAAELSFRARHDTLTGLINRFEFENRLRVALQEHSRKHALLYLDLDQFKLVNDTCGHLAGDAMLRQLADTLSAAVPPGTVLARLGGDEFGYLLTGSGLEEAEALASRVHDIIRGFRYDVGEMSFTVGASIGATFISPEQDHSPDDVLRRADLACYTAKESGRNRTYVYSPADAAMSQRHADISTLSQLQTALTAGQFQLYLQRIQDISERADTQPFYEVLLRYADATGRRPVKEILENAQRYGVIAQVDRWVFEQSARFLQRNAAKHIRLSINVTATTLESAGFEEFVLGLPAQHGFDARQMCIEITEVVAAQNLTTAVAVLTHFREKGFDVALDDFGAGVASFGYLRELPVSMVKIDGNFVRDLGKDPAAAVIIESLARVSALRGLACIAEWVEDEAQIPRLRELGVTYVQGYTIHKPVPMAEIESGNL